jgi:hypothetical protein|tara:strand:+ start:915 stop:1097 length:183 start_codon:yes stop_codon:yes gene_type:complete
VEYVVTLDEKTAQKVTIEFVIQLKRDTCDGGVMEACDIILTHLNPKYVWKHVVDFGVSME